MKKIKTILFSFIFAIMFFVNNALSEINKTQNYTDINIGAIRDVEQPNAIKEIFQNDERISSELKNNILELIDQYQYDLDNYRGAIAGRYKQAELKIVELQRNINNMNNFEDEMEQNLHLAKWMIISLSIGIICLTSVVITMWRSIINVNRNDVEVIFSLEKIKKDLKSLNERMKVLEGLNNISAKEQISDDNNTAEEQKLQT